MHVVFILLFFVISIIVVKTPTPVWFQEAMSDDIAPGLPHLHDKTREYCMTKIFRRHFINNYFGITTEVETNSQTCCDNCSPVMEVQMAKSVSIPCHMESTKYKSIAKSMLSDNYATENAALNHKVMPSAHTGLSESLVEDLSTDSVKFADTDSTV